MKKILSLLSILSISGTAIPNIVAASPYQKQESILKRKKRNFVDDWLKDLENLKLSDSEIRDIHNVYDPIGADIGSDIFSFKTITNTVEYKGGKFTFEWKFYKIFYWTLTMDHKACEVLSNIMYSPEGGAAATFAGTSITAIFQGAGVLSSTGALGTLAVLATAVPALNIFLTYQLIQNYDKGNGMWIGFWINQPGIGWGSL